MTAGDAIAFVATALEPMGAHIFLCSTSCAPQAVVISASNVQYNLTVIGVQGFDRKFRKARGDPRKASDIQGYAPKCAIS